MAKANLPVNFKDDILKENMNGKRRFNMIQNSDGTVSFEDVTEYTQVGSTFGAAQINATNEAVNNAADASKIIDDLDTIKANTKAGYIAGALAVKALSSNLSKNISFTFVATQSGNGQRTLNVSGYKQYLCCDIFYASNDNPLDWGCTTSIGSVDRICSQLSSYCGMSVYLVTTNYTGSVTITMNGHNKNIVNIYGINL